MYTIINNLYKYRISHTRGRLPSVGNVVKGWSSRQHNHHLTLDISMVIIKLIIGMQWSFTKGSLYKYVGRRQTEN